MQNHIWVVERKKGAGWKLVGAYPTREAARCCYRQLVIFEARIRKFIAA
ncbi:hypothetical protein [Bordetella genomosp. 9]|nr:hypothetical protein [Bordetella genomosp. 9]